MPYTKSIVSAVMSALVMVQAPSFFDDSGGLRGPGKMWNILKLEILGVSSWSSIDKAREVDV